MRFLLIGHPDPSAGPPGPQALAAIGQLTEEMRKSGVVRRLFAPWDAPGRAADG
jgi:hypothetical protein